MICFLSGVFLSKYKINFNKILTKFLTLYILFCIGLKGGEPLAKYCNSSALLFFVLLSVLILWGLFSPLLSFCLLRVSTRLDSMTAAAIAASFGSVSIMTSITAITFLEHLHVPYQEFIISMLAIMEVPAIISGIFLAKTFDKTCLKKSVGLGKLIRESLFNKTILTIILGLIFGIIIYFSELNYLGDCFLVFYKPLLCLFLLDMGIHVGLQRENFRSFSWPLNLFGFYMPLIGGTFGLILSYILMLDVGTATLITVLTASASYIAVPAAMKIALPQAKEAVYLPLSIGIAFPFNVTIGIPLYYYLASRILG